MIDRETEKSHGRFPKGRMVFAAHSGRSVFARRNRERDFFVNRLRIFNFTAVRPADAMRLATQRGAMHGQHKLLCDFVAENAGAGIASSRSVSCLRCESSLLFPLVKTPEKTVSSQSISCSELSELWQVFFVSTSIMKTDELREKYLEFFVSKGCTRKPSDVLVPTWDPSVLFTPAGMNQFKDHFLGKCKLEFTKATTCQKCLPDGRYR